MKKTLIILMIVFLLVKPVFALGDAALLQIQLQQISATLKTKLVETVNILKEATVQSKTIVEMRELAINMKENYDFVENFDLQNYMRDFLYEIEGVTLLDNLRGKDFDRQFDLVMKEIDRRFTSEEEKSNYKNMLHDLNRLYSLEKVKANETIAIVGGEQNQANNLATTASNAGLLVMFEAKKERRAILQDKQKMAELEFYRGNLDNAQITMEKLSK